MERRKEKHSKRAAKDASKMPRPKRSYQRKARKEPSEVGDDTGLIRNSTSGRPRGRGKKRKEPATPQAVDDDELDEDWGQDREREQHMDKRQRNSSTRTLTNERNPPSHSERSSDESHSLPSRYMHLPAATGPPRSRAPPIQRQDHGFLPPRMSVSTFSQSQSQSYPDMANMAASGFGGSSQYRDLDSRTLQHEHQHTHRGVSGANGYEADEAESIRFDQPIYPSPEAPNSHGHPYEGSSTSGAGAGTAPGYSSSEEQ